MDSTTSIGYDPRTRTYMQHAFARELLQRMGKAAQGKLTLIRVPPSTRAAYSHISIRDGSILALIETALEVKTSSMDYLSAFFDALSNQTE
jgi:hypothetical protein